MRVVFPRFSLLGWRLATTFSFAAIVSLLPIAGAAQTSTFDVGDRAVVSIEAKRADIQVKTWDRPSVQVESDDDFVEIKGPVGVILDIPVYPARLQLGETAINLPPEDFPVTTVSRMLHDAVKIGSPQSTGTLTVTIPASTAFVIVRAGGGRIRLNDYRSGTFYVALRNGAIALSDVGGDGFVQLLRGHVSIVDSNFSRLRARTAAANMLFENCRARQIEASSVAGSIVYDNGSFDPGLARFDSADGNVAIGVAGNGQIGARTIDGHIYTAFDRRGVPIESRPNETNVSIGGGQGPAVNASSARGNVFLYDGSMATKGNLADEWQPMRQLYANRRRMGTGSRPLAHPLVPGQSPARAEVVPTSKPTPRADRKSPPPAQPHRSRPHGGRP